MSNSISLTCKKDSDENFIDILWYYISSIFKISITQKHKGSRSISNYSSKINLTANGIHKDHLPA